MGILNVTPDSFSDGGVHLDPGTAVAAGRRMLAEGAGMVDVGGESARPGAAPVSPEEEQRRILPVIRALRGAVISVDTRHASTMAAALDAGATVVNDVSALSHDPDARGVVAARGCPVILMHMRGTPETMLGLAQYGDVVAEVTAELAERVAYAVAGGIERGLIAVDPGFGFAKTGDHNVALLRRLHALNAIAPVVAGVSRKRFIGRLSGVTEQGARMAGSVAAGLFAWQQGARILRVHDVAETVQALSVWQALVRSGCDPHPDPLPGEGGAVLPSTTVTGTQA